jgi:prevent-host-death family protein
MQFATVKELRQDLKRLLERVGGGEQVIITRRGKPVAVLSPFPAEEEGALPLSLRPFEEAWAEIEAALEESEPAFPDVEEALESTRSRPRSSRKSESATKRKR